MSVVGNPYRVLRKALERTAKDKLDVHRAMARAVKDLIKDQFRSGVNPYGNPQKDTKRGAPGLVSTQLANAIKVVPNAAGVEGTGKVKSRRQWLDAHQEGHTFPARTSTGNRIAFNAKGERVSIARLKKATGGKVQAKRITVGAREAYWTERKNVARLKGRITNARAHRVGERVLPQRRIYPEGDMGKRWSGHIRPAVSIALAKQLERNVKEAG